MSKNPIKQNSPIFPPSAKGASELPPQLRNYQDHVLRLKSSPYLDYPAHVHIETMSVCNASCQFCPYSQLARKGTRMSDALIGKIIGDLTDIPRTLPLQVSPFKVNEPFLDSRIFDIIADINLRLPQATLTLTTNGSVLDEQIVQRLALVKNLGYLWISFNEHRAERYQEVMGLPFARTFESLELLHRARAEGRLPCRIILSRVGDGTQLDGEFSAWVRSTFPLFETSIFPRGGWLGQAGMTQEPVPPVGCSRWFELSITSTGQVAHCCMDGTAEYPIGDVTNQHALEIYNAPNYRRLREICLTRQEIAPCRNCGFM
jgi:MoaA/NifB/PqqE/SkfB family radical SAM enzyme